MPACCHPPISPLFRSKEGASQAALIFMKISQFIGHLCSLLLSEIIFIHIKQHCRGRCRSICLVSYTVKKMCMIYAWKIEKKWNSYVVL